MFRGARIGVLLLFSVLALGAAPVAHASSSPPTMRALLTHQGVWADGRYLMYREPAGASPADNVAVLYDAQTLKLVRRLTLPQGCAALYFRFGKLLLRCPSSQPSAPSWSYSWGLMNPWSGEVSMFSTGTEAAGYLDGYAPEDSFDYFSRYWLVGRREGFMDPTYAYVNLKTGRVTLIVEDRYDDTNDNTFVDPDDPQLGRYEYGACSRARPGRYEVAFRHFLGDATGARDVFLYDCRQHTRERIARCVHGCVGTPRNSHPADGLALWLSPRDRRLYARHVTGRRTCTWQLPRSSSLDQAFVAGGHVFASITRPGASAPQLRVARPRRC